MLSNHLTVLFTVRLFTVLFTETITCKMDAHTKAGEG